MSPIGKPHPKDKFTPSEDQKLRMLVSVLGPSNWKKVSEYMVSRNARQCRDRYKNYLSPNLNSSPWSQEDDAKLLQLVDFYGRKWSLIAKEFNGRTDINIKSRYALLMRQEERDKQKKMFLSSEPEIQFENISETSYPHESNQNQQPAYFNQTILFDFNDNLILKIHYYLEIIYSCSY
ncbi:Myb-like DNA-binding domain containing protein [Trichomonas vaginalis G3]|uniref:Myb-like DNA-binding domain containing protein n=1 Tax=Trichomonas vaginalis (strain ATCC PRA-98 / G3) TaxID=412133 RepID=A2FBW4_TRIV3|nr:RNA polymerase II transcription regulator recruiting protein [Trichomonas vaginalis G3]EAX97610.1 Myb-like DNA-binding domain containing protein [Trichomonas vaginalis G3]KAI5510576.1 RNA polymerase II transcription regulator recruiting protein [Trichomonas vaginalis G3]|eukprot:XP_001310540.1 Myb-like DNA-binding domain containing protein [Trichomonas vaginalis G3]